MIRLTSINEFELLINKDHISAIKLFENITTVYMSDRNTPLKVKESIEQIEDMILRDKLAMSAMNGLMSADYEANTTNDEIAKWSYKQADAMLKQRKEK